MTSVDSNFNFLCGRPHGAGPPPVHMRPPEPDPLPSLRVDVINGWPLNSETNNDLCLHTTHMPHYSCSRSLPPPAPGPFLLLLQVFSLCGMKMLLRGWSVDRSVTLGSASERKMRSEIQQRMPSSLSDSAIGQISRMDEMNSTPLSFNYRIMRIYRKQLNTKCIWIQMKTIRGSETVKL